MINEPLYKVKAREFEMKVTINKTNLELRQGDITASDTEAIVNAANSNLILGSGVAGAIRTMGGPTIQSECNKIGFTPVGTAVVTGAGRLKASYVIHAVGPRAGEGNEKNKLANATENSLKMADLQNIKSLTFPAISTGVFGFAVDRCADIMLTKVIEYLNGGKTNLEQVVFCLFTPADYKTFTNSLRRLKPDASNDINQTS